MILWVMTSGSEGTPTGCEFSPKSTINSSGVPVTRQKLAVGFDMPIGKIHARHFRKLRLKPVHERLIVEVERLGECESTLLPDENIIDAPSTVAVPRRNHIPEHLVHAAGPHPGQRHRLLVFDEPHQAVTGTAVNFGIE